MIETNWTHTELRQNIEERLYLGVQWEDHCLKLQSARDSHSLNTVRQYELGPHKTARRAYSSMTRVLWTGLNRKSGQLPPKQILKNPLPERIQFLYRPDQASAWPRLFDSFLHLKSDFFLIKAEEELRRIESGHPLFFMHGLLTHDFEIIRAWFNNQKMSGSNK